MNYHDKADKTRGAIELTSEGIKNAGLMTSRRAFVHLEEVDVDRPTNGLNFPPGMRVWGRLTEQTVYGITKQLVENLVAKNVMVIKREQQA
jgi:hypothetical protein